MAALSVEGLTRRFGRVVAVDGISFAVERGQVFGLLGPNGSGKSTTLACALGLLRPTAGAVRILGEPAGRIHRTRGRVAAVFDEPMRVKGLTVKRQLAYAARLRGHSGGRDTARALELVGLASLAGRPVTKLSLGQSKRLAIAGALAGSPELLVLDEPLSGLDPVGVRDLLATVRNLASEGITVLLSSHRLHELEDVVTHLAILLGGRVAANGALDELLGSRSRYRIVVDDAQSARGRLAELAGVEVLAEQALAGPASELAAAASGLATRRTELTVDAGTHAPGELNHALVHAGVTVHGLRPVEVSLPALFDSLLARAETAGGAA